MAVELSEVIRLVYFAIFATCALTDIWLMRIPNVLVLALLALFVVAALVNDAEISWLQHVIPAAVALAIGAALFYFEKFGGGDVKLLATAILWTGFDGLSGFLIILGIAGIVLLLVFYKLRQPALFGFMRLQQASGLNVPVPKALDTATHLPYGVAIAVAAMFAAGNIPLLH